MFQNRQWKTKKKKKGKLIAIILAAVLAVAAVVGIFVAVFNKKESAKSMVQQGLVMHELPELRLAEDKAYNDLIALNFGAFEYSRRYYILLQLGVKNTTHELFYSISHKG